MKTIAVIGASGQVGTELCIMLHLMPDVRVIAICRSKLSSALLERCGIQCRIGSLMDFEDAKTLLRGCDLVFDLSLPRGLASEIRLSNLKLISNAVAAAPAGTRYVFASTYMALGIGSPGEKFAYRLISRSSYGTQKRVLERAAIAAGRKQGREIYVLRLGQVHGEMQSVSRGLLSAMTSQKTFVPEGPSNTVFVFSIAEALISIAEARETPGTYMMTSNPQWSWKELTRYFAEKAGMHSEIVEIPRWQSSVAVASRLTSHLTKVVLRHREIMLGYVLARFPILERKAAARYYISGATLQIAQAESQGVQLFKDMYVGDAPGRRLKSISDSRTTMRSYSERVRRTLLSLTQ